MLTFYGFIDCAVWEISNDLPISNAESARVGSMARELNLEKGPSHEYRRLGCKHMETVGLTLQRDSLIRLREPSNASPIWCLANFQAMVVSDNRDFGRITAFCGGL